MPYKQRLSSPYGCCAVRFLASVFIVTMLPVVSFAQQNVTPHWPQIKLVSCPAIGQPRDSNQRNWKYGDAEQNDFWAAVKTKDNREGAELLSRFAGKYPDSDYREPALFGEWTAYVSLKDRNGQLQAAEAMVQLREAEPLTRTAAFMTLVSVMSPSVVPDDPQKYGKLADLEKWTQCGAIAMKMKRKGVNQSEDAYEKQRRYEESIWDRTDGFIALMRQNYTLAAAKLEEARERNSQDTLTYLWLAVTNLLSPDANPNSGIFYLARATELAPQATEAAPGIGEAYVGFLKQMYVIVHGSEKGLSHLRELAKNETTPPDGLKVLRQPRQKRNSSVAIATTAIAGLLIYRAAAHPDFMVALAQSFGNKGAERKLMIFGGLDHRTYLGCLSCEETARDSILNEFGQYGSPYRPESIWNHYKQFGSTYSPYSSCNELATDPPVILDQDGIAYGRLTLNRNSPKIGAGVRFCDWLASAVCRN